jgi:futalosine hydrolase
MSATQEIEALILVPTPLELELLLPHFGSHLGVALAPCGFGPVGAATMTQYLLQRHHPKRVVLAGIAGSFSEDLQCGQCYTYESVLLDGIGVHGHDGIISPEELGFSHCYNGTTPYESIVHRELRLQLCTQVHSAAALLTVCAASGTPDMANARRRAYPQATTEDMEGYGVAMACAVSQIPLTILRGISNRAGIRDKQKWMIKEALESVGEAIRNWHAAGWR